MTRRLGPLPLDERGQLPTETGARCYGRTHETIPSGPVVRHDVVRDAQRFEPLAERTLNGQVVAVEGRIEIHRGGPGVLCANPTGVPCLKIADVVDASYGDTLRSGRIDFPVVHGLMLVRMGPAGVTDVVSIDTTTPDDLPACGRHTYPSGIEFTDSETADPTCAEAIEEMKRGLPRASQALRDERLFIEKAELADDRIVITVAGLAALGEPAHALIAGQVRTPFGDRFPVDVRPEGGSGSEPGAHTIADCDDVDRYGELIEDVGISYDYSASDSPEDLANRADLVIAGTLVSVRTEAEAGVDEALDIAVLEVAVDRILSGSAPESPATVEVAFQFNAAYREATEYENAPIGAAVVVFAYRVETGSAEYRASFPEGIWIACDTVSEPSAGALSTRAGWQGVSTIGDLTTILLDLTLEAPQPVTTRWRPYHGFPVDMVGDSAVDTDDGLDDFVSGVAELLQTMATWPETAELTSLDDQGPTAIAVFAQRGFPGDSVAGRDLRLYLRRGPNGWYIESAEARDVCARSTGTDVDVCL